MEETHQPARRGTYFFRFPFCITCERTLYSIEILLIAKGNYAIELLFFMIHQDIIQLSVRNCPYVIIRYHQCHNWQNTRPRPDPN